MVNQGGRVPLTVVVLTFNEERNLEACLESVAHWAEELFIVDSRSTDRTVDSTRRQSDQARPPWRQAGRSTFLAGWSLVPGGAGLRDSIWRSRCDSSRRAPR